MLAVIGVLIVGYVLALTIVKKYRSMVWYKSGKKGFVFFFVNGIVWLLISGVSYYFQEPWWILAISGALSLISWCGLFILGEVFTNLSVVNKRRNNGKK